MAGKKRSGWVPQKGNHYSAARNLGSAFARAASFAGKALALAGRAASSRPSPRSLPRGAGRRPSSDSPPDCAVLGELSSILPTAQYVAPRRHAKRVAESTPHAPHFVTRVTHPPCAVPSAHRWRREISSQQCCVSTLLRAGLRRKNRNGPFAKSST